MYTNLQLTNYTFTTTKISKTTSIVVISDSHNNFSSKWLSMIRSTNPSYILIVGDLMLGRKLAGSDVCVRWSNLNTKSFEFLKSLLSIAPVYMSLGNHEALATSQDLCGIQKMGVEVLDNSYVSLDEGIILGGLTSGLVTCYRRYGEKRGIIEKIRGESHHEFYHHGESDFELSEPDYQWGDTFERECGYKILMSHHPEYWSLRNPKLIDRNIDLVLSGHAHGGQIRLFDRGLYSPGQGFLPEFTKGEYKGKNGVMIVGAGMANTYRIPRVFNPLELINITIKSIRN